MHTGSSRNLHKLFEYEFNPNVVNTKVEKPYRTFDLISVKGRHEYFKYKLGEKLNKFQKIFTEQTFIAYMMAPKLAGKGTYLSILREIVGKDAFVQVSVGDLVREFQREYHNRKNEYYALLSREYRGFISLDEAIDVALHPDITKTIPTELILALVKHKIRSVGRKIVFLDGFPRTEDQILYTLFMRELVQFREDPDLLVLINIPLEVLDARIRYRRVCPKCGASRSIKFLPTENVAWDKEKQEVVLLCDTPECNKEPMVRKQGDELGLEPLMPRMERDFKLMNIARSLHGIPKAELYNAVPVEQANELVDDYEITPEYDFVYEDGQIKRTTKPWQFESGGRKYYSLLAAPVVIQLVNQVLDLFNID